MRLFYSAYLNRENMGAYQALVDRLVHEAPGVLRSIPPLTHHLTLAFLGEIAEGDVEKCSSALDAVERFVAFEYSLGPPNILMGRGRPRLIRVSTTEGVEQVREIQTALISRVAENLSSIETRFKPPHITLARFKKYAHRAQARQVEAALARDLDTPLPERDRFSSVKLVKSTLAPSGPNYETLCEIHLAGGL